MKKNFVILAVVLLSNLIIEGISNAQSFSSPNVPIDDPVYRQIDKLVAFGLTCALGIALCAVTTLVWFPALLAFLKGRRPAPAAALSAKRPLALLLVCILLLASSNALAYSAPNVPIDSLYYRDVDKLVAADLVKDVIYGQRPWSRIEFARIVSVAMKNRAKQGGPIAPDDREISFKIYIDDVLERLKREFHEELIDRGEIEGEAKGLRLKALESVQFDYTILDSPFRQAPVFNGLGSIDAFINPLVANREGRHYVDGSTIGLETTHRAKLSKYFSLYVRPRLEILVPNTSPNDINPIVQQLYGKFAYRNFELEVGRDSLIWGPGEFGGLMLSNNARPLDMFKISTSSPFHHPWIFKYLGPSKYTFFIANLGPEREFPQTFLYGLRVSIRPAHFFEWGLNHTVFMGGDGAPSIKWWDPISEFFFVRRGGLRGQGSQVADHRMGFDWRVRVPRFRNMEWYLETIWDDIGRETRSANITEQMGFTMGLYFPRLTAEGTTDLRIEYNHIPPIVYRHSRWISGHSLNRRLLGHEAEPDSDMIALLLRHEFNENILWSSRISYRNIDSDLHDQTVSSKGAVDRVVKVTNNPTEHRFGFTEDFLWKFRENMSAEITLGYEHVMNFNFRRNEDISNFLCSLSLVWHPAF